MDNHKNTSSLTTPIIVIIVIVLLVIVGYFIYSSKVSTGITENSNATSTLATTNVANVATVNGVAITKANLDTQIASAIASYKTQGIEATSTEQLALIKTQVLDNLIGNELLAQGLAASGLQVTAAEIDKEVAALVTQSGGQDKFAEALTKNNLTEEQLRANLSKQLLSQKYLLANIDVKSITVTDAEISAFYAKYSKSLKDSGQKVPTLKELSAQIKQQLTSDKEQVLITNFVATLRAKANVVIN